MDNIIEAWAEMCRVLYPKAYEQAMKLHSNPVDAQALAAEYAPLLPVRRTADLETDVGECA